MTRWMIRAAAVVCVGLVSAGFAQAQQAKPPAPADLATLLAVMRDPAATAAQKEKLVGKVYGGVVSIDAIRLPDPSNIAIWAMLVEPASTGPAPAVVRLTFAATANDEKVMQLRPRQQVRVRATLRSVSMERMAIANFTDLVIEGPVK